MTNTTTLPTSHDQNIKNLILDFLLMALRFFAGKEGQDLPPDTEITLVREEQRKDELSLGHRVLDLPLRARLPRGERETFVLDLEAETHPRFFSIRRARATITYPTFSGA